MRAWCSRAGLIGLTALAIVGCGGGVRPCKAGTLLLTATLEPAAATANALVVEVTAGGQVRTTTVTRPSFPRSGSLEIDFGGGYPVGQLVTVQITAKQDAATLATGLHQVLLAAQCESLAIDVGTSPAGAAVPDAGGAADLAPADGGIPSDGAVPADMVAPSDLLPPVDLASCAATSAAADHFVDPKRGADDARHGGAAGACAYKTITFALTQGTGSIVLAAGQTYSGLETLPLTLHGAQVLVGDTSAAAQPIILAQPGARDAVVVIATGGGANALRNLVVDGGGNQIDCVDIFSAGGATVDHDELRGCTFAIKVEPGADQVGVTSCTIHDVGWGVDLQGGLHNSVRQNNIRANPYPILCAYDSGAMKPIGDATGCGNVLSDGDCAGCGDCAALVASCPS